MPFVDTRAKTRASGFIGRTPSMGILRRSQGGPTTPRTIFGASLKQWLKADSGVYSDAGVTLATDGGTIAQWNDQSGNGVHLTQGTAGNKPLYRASGFHTNSLPSVDFDGTDDFLFNTLDYSGAITIAHIYALDGTPTSLHSLSSIKETVDADFMETLCVEDASYKDITVKAKTKTAAVGVGFDSTFDLDAHQLIWTYNDGTSTDVASYDIFFDGVEQTVLQSGQVGRENDSGSVGARNNALKFAFPGRLAEIVVVSSVASAAQIAALTDYFNDKYGAF